VHMDNEGYWRAEIDWFLQEGLTRNIKSLRFLDATHGIDENGHNFL
jgi:hypothetical protein